METSQPTHRHSRDQLHEWQENMKQNPYQLDKDFQHSVSLYFNDEKLENDLSAFAEKVVTELELLVAENNYRFNLPRIEKYNSIGERTEQIVHHPNYVAAGNIIYGSRILERFAKIGGMLESLIFFFLSGQIGEGGHNCPIACSAGIIRVLQKIKEVANAEHYIKKLCLPSFSENYTGAQFLTEIQGGSDVGQNATVAHQDEQGQWRIFGEKWFCSNANADLILLTARYSQDRPGTSGLALFLVPKFIERKHNSFSMRRLKEKIGTCSMASAEIDFQDAVAYPVGKLEDGFKLVMENVLHISRLFNSICVLGMARRAYNIALAYSKSREAFGNPIFNYPLVKENLAGIKAENNAALASILATINLQDKFDLGIVNNEPTQLLLRLLANINKYISALWTVEHIHHALDVLAGNGAIESFSSIPRLLRDSIVCENWEGTHNTLRMQILRDIHRYEIDVIFLDHIKTELNPIEDQERKAILLGFLSDIEQSCQNLRRSESDIQTLQIRSLVHHFSMLYLGVCLLKEAIHQKNSTSNTSKLACFDYFSLLHLINKPLVFNKNYLALIEEIVAS